MKKMSVIYSKDSFDRFGDDLTEVLLSYLKTKDIFNYECVSKQWKSLIFNKKYKLYICKQIYSFDSFFIKTDFELPFENIISNKNYQNFKPLKNIFKKCLNIKSIVLYNFDNSTKDLLFNLIIKYCDNLTEIKSKFDYLTQNTVIKFFEKFGSKLEKINFVSIYKIYNNKEVFDYLIKFRKTIEIINILQFNELITNSNEFLFKNLRKITFNCYLKDFDIISTIIDSKRSLESIEISNIDSNNSVLNFNEKSKILFNCISNSTKLKSFTFICNHFIVNELFANNLREISKKCLNLKKIGLSLETNSFATDFNIFNSINCFKQLNRFSIIGH